MIRWNWGSEFQPLKENVLKWLFNSSSRVLYIRPMSVLAAQFNAMDWWRTSSSFSCEGNVPLRYRCEVHVTVVVILVSSFPYTAMESRIRRRQSTSGSDKVRCINFMSNEYTRDFCINCGNHKNEHRRLPKPTAPRAAVRYFWCSDFTTSTSAINYFLEGMPSYQREF